MKGSQESTDRYNAVEDYRSNLEISNLWWRLRN